MTQVDAAHARSGEHRARLGEREPRVLGAQQLEELDLLAVIGAGGIPERRPDAAEALGDELVLRSLIARLVPPAPRNLVQVLGERLREAVGEGLRHDRAIVVVLGLEPGRELVEAVPGGDRECTEMVAGRGDEVGEAAVRSRIAVRGLLAQERETRAVVEHNVVAVRVCAPPAVDPARL